MGHFDPIAPTLTNQWSRTEGGIHRITRPDTPFPWLNFMQSRDGLYLLSVDQRGRGRAQFAHGENLVSTGRNVVVDDGEGRPWSALGGAAPAEAAQYECVQEPGQSTFTASRAEIEVCTTVVLDPDTYQDVTGIAVRNTSRHDRTVLLTAVHHIALQGRDNSNQLDHTEFDDATGALLARRYHEETARNRYAAYWIADRWPDSWCGSAQDFTGADVLPGQETAWSADPLPQVGVSSTPPLFAFRYHLKLAPDEKVSIHLVLGIEETIDACRSRVCTAADEGPNILARSREHHEQALAGSRIETPELAITAHANRWSRLQLLHQNVSARRGLDHNWRNNLQDAMGYQVIDPSFARQRLVQVAALAEPDGFMRRSTPKGAGTDARLQHLVTQRHNDIATWAGFAAARYLAETGDLDVLEERPGEYSVLEALDRGLIWTLDNRGAHGLVLFLDGDWSDPLEAAGREGRGESIWTSFAVVNAIRRLTPFLRHIGEDERAERLEQGANDVSAAINAHAWDGQWYIRGFTDSGRPFCTSEDSDGNVPMLMQAWAVLSGVAPPDRAQIAIETVEQTCLSPFGPALYDPPFLTERPDLGRETSKRPGTAENGSVYTHGAMMLVAAELELGRADTAAEILRTVLPLRTDDVYSTRAGSPLWWPNYYQSPYGAAPGRSSDLISSGAPAWFLINLTEGLLGIRPTLDGLTIRPALPSTWSHAEMQRTWRGSLYNITISRAGRDRIAVDGVELTSAAIPPPNEPGTHIVDVEIA